MEKLIKSVDNGSVSFVINLNFNILNLIDFRSFGIFPKIRPQKKLTRSSTSVLIWFQKILMSKATCLTLKNSQLQTSKPTQIIREGKKYKKIRISSESPY